MTGLVGLLGAGGHARVVAGTLARLGQGLGGVFDSDPARLGRMFDGLPVQADTAVAALDGWRWHIAIGANAVRRRIAERRATQVWLTLIDPGARLAEGVDVGEGSLIGLGALVQVGARIGRHAIVNTGAIVEHDGVIGDFVHVAPGAILCGAVQVGAEVLIGAGAVVLPGRVIGRGAIVGSGAVVTRDVAPGAVVVGSPARAVMSSPDGERE